MKKGHDIAVMASVIPFKFKTEYPDNGGIPKPLQWNTKPAQ